MSHYMLWLQSVKTQEPMIVLEHDAVVQAAWPEDLDYTGRLIKLYRSAECKQHPVYGTWSKGAHAYTLTPAQAQTLIEFSQAHGAEAVDKHLGTSVLDWCFYDHDLVTLDPARGPSSTSAYTRTL
jgi:GR25 family glycosyltransferase involved in LPS biosynthesis